ncbi:MAG: GspE/PulE family protein, partial [Gammaproteobacteria bacterium]
MLAHSKPSPDMWNAEKINHLLKFGIPLFDLTAFDITSIPENIISETLIRQHYILPLFVRDNHLYVAMADPANQKILDDIKFQTALQISSVSVELEKLTILITRFLEKKTSPIEDDESPIVNFVRQILLDAIEKKASDIHFEPHEKNYRIRYRRDGILYTAATPDYTIGNRIASRIKIMSDLDISERRLPQDGRFRL